MSKPTPIVLILVGVGLGLFGLRMFGIEPFQYKWVLALSICLVAYAAYLYVIEKRQNSNSDTTGFREPKSHVKKHAARQISDTHANHFIAASVQDKVCSIARRR